MELDITDPGFEVKSKKGAPVMSLGVVDKAESRASFFEDLACMVLRAFEKGQTSAAAIWGSSATPVHWFAVSTEELAPLRKALSAARVRFRTFEDVALWKVLRILGRLPDKVSNVNHDVQGSVLDVGSAIKKINGLGSDPGPSDTNELLKGLETKKTEHDALAWAPLAVVPDAKALSIDFPSTCLKGTDAKIMPYGPEWPDVAKLNVSTEAIVSREQGRVLIQVVVENTTGGKVFRCSFIASDDETADKVAQELANMRHARVSTVTGLPFRVLSFEYGVDSGNKTIILETARQTPESMYSYFGNGMIAEPGTWACLPDENMGPNEIVDYLKKASNFCFTGKSLYDDDDDEFMDAK